MPKKLTNEEFIEKSKQIHGEKYDYSIAEYICCRKRIKIICPEHGMFSQLSSAHLNGSGCSVCSKNKKLSTEDFIKRSIEIHKNKDGSPKYTYEKAVYTNALSKLTICCPKHGHFSSEAHGHLKGYGCPACAVNNRSSNLQEFIGKAQEIHKNEDGEPKYIYDKVNYSTANAIEVITCPLHGNFNQRLSSHIQGNGCPSCAGRKSPSTEEFVEIVKKIHVDENGDPKYLYNYTNYINIEENIVITCKIHGNFNQIPSVHARGSGCPSCAGNNKSCTEEFIKKAKEKHKNTDGSPKYSYENVEYIRNNAAVEILCKRHGPFCQTPSNHMIGHGCPYCKNKTEEVIREILKSLNIDFERQKKIEKKSFDFYITEFNIIIERDGEQHYGNSATMKCFRTSLEFQQANDTLKTNIAKSKGYKIARIPYWLNKEEITTEIKNILAGFPTYPEIPNPDHILTMPRPRPFNENNN